jgi:hypothetical protein
MVNAQGSLSLTIGPACFGYYTPFSTMAAVFGLSIVNG